MIHSILVRKPSCLPCLFSHENMGLFRVLKPQTLKRLLPTPEYFVKFLLHQISSEVCPRQLPPLVFEGFSTRRRNSEAEIQPTYTLVPKNCPGYLSAEDVWNLCCLEPVAYCIGACNIFDFIFMCLPFLSFVATLVLDRCVAISLGSKIGRNLPIASHQGHLSVETSH